MHESEYVLEFETREILWDFEMQTDYRIPGRRTDQVFINWKRIYHLEGSCRSGGPEKGYIKTGKYLNFAMDLKKRK